MWQVFLIGAGGTGSGPEKLPGTQNTACVSAAAKGQMRATNNETVGPGRENALRNRLCHTLKLSAFATQCRIAARPAIF
ncbi:hypothetical protein ATO10_05027 [Actibacterium atlanticum]|uniref:Uncharacterized protein n=1 Tax=Actibacterium atlanticum TaxID=1461693 RepID=A0A058ZNY4_9RHOB|nr:hypothetical protein ATO10_05027 [Actibacterium atlanticum]